MRITKSACLLSWLAFAVGAGCSGRDPAPVPNHALLRTPLGPTLARLWTAHGGLGAWRSAGRIAVNIRVTGDPPAFESPPIPLRFDAHDWTEIRVGSRPDTPPVDLTRSRPLRGEALIHDYHVRTARALFLLPFAIAEPGWELRRDVYPGAEAGEKEGFWAIPEGVPTPHVGYFLVPDPRTGRLATVYYQVNHPHFRGYVFRADFDGYREREGLAIPTEIRHRLVSKLTPGVDATEPRLLDPFDPQRQAGPETATGEAGGAFPVPTLDHEIHWELRYEDILIERSVPEAAPASAESERAASESAPSAAESGDGPAAEAGPTSSRSPGGSRQP